MLVRHRLWGPVLMPYMLRTNPFQGYFSIAESLFPNHTEVTMINLSPEERETVSILNQYSDRQLFRVFSKDKNVKEFLENLTPGKIEEHIRPYIEKRIYKCLEIARNEAIPVFYQKSEIKSFHKEDIMKFEPYNALPVFRFEKGSAQSTYSLTVEAGGKALDIRKIQTEIICIAPCIIRFDKRIVFVSDIDGAKLKPFLTRESITIPANSEKKYFSTFVLNAVNNFKVEAKGFGIVQHEPEKEAILDVEIGLKGYPALILSFSYSGHKIYLTDKESSFTKFEDNNGKYLFRKYSRDFKWEEDCVEILGGLGFYSDDGINFNIPSLSGDYKYDLQATLEAVSNCSEDLKAAGFTVNTKRLDKKYALSPVRLEMNHSVSGDWFDITAKVKIGDFELPFLLFRRHILSGIREYELPDKTIAILPEAWFTKYRNIFEFGSIESDRMKIHKQHFSLLTEVIEGKERETFMGLDKLLLPDSIPVVEPPSGLNTELRKYQVEGLSWMMWLQSARLGGCLADDMGLGKTVQTLALILASKEDKQGTAKVNLPAEPTLFDPPISVKTSLVIVPASLIYNWETEIKRFTPSLTVHTYKGNQRKKNNSHFGYYDIILSSYHIVRQDIDIFSSFNFHYVILDESQAIKNPSSIIYRAVSMLKSDHRLVLTGTPVENSLSDLWTQLSFVNPGLLGSLAFFRREFAKPIEKMMDEEKEEGLRKIIKPFILRRTKEMVASDLPPLTEQTLYCDMTEEQAEIYEKEKSAVRNSIMKSMETSGQDQNAILVLQGLMRLRQLANHPSMIYEDYSGGSGKFETVVRDLENVLAEKHKILMFSSFVKHLILYADYLNDRGIKYSMLTGASTGRGKIIEGFQKNPDNRIFLISLKAGGVGLNLTSADYVFMLDPWWNPAAEMQAFNRAHRIGQDKNVFVYRYISGLSIEEKIIRLQERKSELADTFIRSNNPLKDIDLKDILEIIG